MIHVNGEERADLPEGMSVRALLDALDLPGAGRGVAVAVDAEVVPRAEWDVFAIADGAQVEVLNAVQGG
jgi:sulfur carrier protein